MKIVKGSYVSGYLKMHIISAKPEYFLEKCARNGVMLWDIKRISAEECTAMIQLKDVKKIKKLRFGSRVKIRFSKKTGIPFVNRSLQKKKPFLLGLLLSIVLFYLLSNMVWKVEVTGLPEELENRIYKQLKTEGIYPGAFNFKVTSPNQIQLSLLENIPELLWVGVEKKGTSYFLEGVEKLIVEDKEPKSPRHLVAAKNGVIKSMYVKKGLPVVSVNEFVEKGKILVSGAIENPMINEDGEEEVNHVEWLAAEGEVIAVTWYQAKVEVPLQAEHIELTGKVEENYYLKLGSVTIPLWPWMKDSYKHEVQDVHDYQLELFGLTFPIHFINKTRMESIPILTERSKEEAIQAAIVQARKDLGRQLDKEAKIITEKVLHESIEHGKVKLSLYISVEENIAVEQPINQGD